MENRIYGILTICVAVLLYGLAYQKYRKQKFELCLFLIILGGLILRVFTSFDFYLHEWDERYHALVAKNLIENPFKPMLYTNPILEYDYRNWASNHIWVHKQPIPLYSMALSMSIFGVNTIALRIPSIILSTTAIFATSRIGEILIDKKTGLLASFLFSINGLIIESTGGRVATDHIDVFFYSLITIAIYFLLKSVDQKSLMSILIGAILTGFAILSKWLPALIVLPIWLTYSYQKQCLKSILKNILVFVPLVVAVVIPWQLYIMDQFPIEAAWEYEYNKKHIFEAFGPHEKPFYFHLNRMRVIFGELVYIPLIWLLFTAYSDFTQGKYAKLILVIWILIPYTFFSLVVTKMQGYILFCSSAIFIMIAMFFFELELYKTKFKNIRIITLILLLALPIRYSIERIKPFSLRDRNPNWISEMKSLNNNENKSVVFNCRYPIETMFHTEIIAYESIPNLKNLKELEREGYKIYIDNHKIIKNELSELNFVNYIEITGPEYRE